MPKNRTSKWKRWTRNYAWRIEFAESICQFPPDGQRQTLAIIQASNRLAKLPSRDVLGEFAECPYG